MEIAEINLGISFREFEKLSREEKVMIRNKGNELCEKLAKEFLANNPGIDFVAYAFDAERGGFYVAKKGVWGDVPSSRNSPFSDYLNRFEEGINKIVFTWNKAPMVERIFLEDIGDQGFMA